MRCPKCRFDNLEDASFCRRCGNRLEIVCPECGRKIPPDSIFCQKCGHDLSKPKEVPRIDYSKPHSYTPQFLADKILTSRSSIEGERKLVTVLFADVANYCTISEKLDPEEVHQIMDGCFKILMDEIHPFEGTINQFTGDGVMALFGAPVAHEDHGQRAGHAALSIQKAIEGYGNKIKEQYGTDFKMRIGLNSGPVIVGSIGDDLRMDYTALGDTTNLAFRMQTEARPASVLVSENTRRLIRDFFEFEPVGKVKVKGKEAPQEAYELIRPTGVETRIAAAAAKGLTQFVGRNKEMEFLGEAFDRARDGSGQVVGVVGEAGVGKSRLILEFRNTLATDECTCLEGRCHHYGATMAYLPILDAVKSYFNVQEDDREYIIKKKLREGLCQLDENLLGSLPCLHELLSLKVEDTKYLQTDPQQRKMMTFEAIRDLLIRQSQTKPLIFAVEDLHWIDRTSQEFLDYLIDWLPNVHILLVLLYRPEYKHTWGNRSYYTQISLDQLTPLRSTELVRAILGGGEIAQEVRHFVLRKAGGNPLFVEELTNSLLENGTIQRKDHQVLFSRKASEIQVPETIQGIIAARMDRIEENLKRIMQMASVIGREFGYRILQTIMEMRAELKVSLLDLQSLEFIYEKQLFPELEYIFKHALTQEVAYNSLLAKRRKEIHERVGGAIEELYSERLEEYYELLAYHYVRSENKEKAVDYLRLAARKALETRALEDAKAYFDEAMGLLNTMPETDQNLQRRVSLLACAGRVFYYLMKLPEYYELLTKYEPVAARVDDAGLAGGFHGRLGMCELLCETSPDFLDRAIETLTKAAALCEAGDNAEDAGYAYLQLEICHYCKGDFERVDALKERILDKMDQVFDLTTCVRAMAWAAHAYYLTGRWEEGIELFQRALRTAREFTSNSMVSFTAALLSSAYAHRGDLERAIEYGELAVARAATPMDKLSAQGALAWAWCKAGETNKGIEVLSVNCQLARAVGFVMAEATMGYFLADGFLLAREYERAKHGAEELLLLAEPRGMRHFIGLAHLVQAEVALETNPADAASHFDQAIATLQEIKAEVWLPRAYAGYGRYYRQHGENLRSREYLTKSLEISERLGTLIERDRVRQELAETSQ